MSGSPDGCEDVDVAAERTIQVHEHWCEYEQDRQAIVVVVQIIPQIS